MRKGEITKRRIVEGAIDLFYSKGFENVTFEQIAKKAKLTQPALYMYFESKLHLLATCGAISAELGLNYIEEKIDPMAPPNVQFRRYVEANFEWFSANKARAYSLLSIYYFANSSKIINELRNKVESGGVSRISIFIQQGHFSKIWKTTDIRTQARLIHSLMVGEMFKMYYEMDNLNSSDRSEQIMSLVHTLLKN